MRRVLQKWPAKMYPMSDWTAKIKIMMRKTIRPVNCSSKEIVLCHASEGVNY